MEGQISFKQISILGLLIYLQRKPVRLCKVRQLLIAYMHPLLAILWFVFHQIFHQILIFTVVKTSILPLKKSFIENSFMVIWTTSFRWKFVIFYLFIFRI